MLHASAATGPMPFRPHDELPADHHQWWWELLLVAIAALSEELLLLC
jgi:hypothetical protein